MKGKISMSMLLGAGAIAAGYVAYSIIPNLFARRGYTNHQMDLLSISAHRGGAGLGLENTLSCIEAGINSGADSIEIDIRLTADGEIVVCHDSSIDRTTDGTGEIKNLALDQIRQFKVVDKAGNTTAERIPTLDEVLEKVAGRCRLLVEIKHEDCSYGIERKLVEAIHHHDAADWIAIQSFSDLSLDEVHRIDPSLRLEKMLIFRLQGLPSIFDGKFTAFDYDKYKHVASFNVYYRSVTKSMIERIHKHGKEVKIWTLAGPEDTPCLPVDGIITDRPDLWRKNRAR